MLLPDNDVDDNENLFVTPVQSVLLPDNDVDDNENLFVTFNQCSFQIMMLMIMRIFLLLSISAPSR